jgi:nucleoside 2-deoxyribosyltransferase
MMTDLERQRTAVHEAGHFVAAFILRGDVAAVVTLRPAASYGGACIRPHRGVVDFGGHDRHAPLALADPTIRRAAETILLSALAGDAAADVLTPRMGRQPIPPSEEAVAAEIARLEQADADRLTAAEAEPIDLSPFAGDEGQALELGYRLVGQRAGALVAFMRSEARAFVVGHAAAIVACAEELAARGVVPGADLAAIVDRIEGEGEAHAETPPNAAV